MYRFSTSSVCGTVICNKYKNTFQLIRLDINLFSDIQCSYTQKRQTIPPRTFGNVQSFIDSQNCFISFKYISNKYISRHKHFRHIIHQDHAQATSENFLMFNHSCTCKIVEFDGKLCL